jgi:hypothetical protein
MEDQTKETAEERQERQMLDAMINGYHARLYVPSYIELEADGLD